MRDVIVITRNLSAHRTITLAILVLMLLGPVACTPVQPARSQAIVGHWTNADGGAIDFYADGRGHIPGEKGTNPPVSEVSFTYYFPDETHLGIKMEAQAALVFEVKIEGDKMIWRAPNSDVEFVYTRARPS